MVQKWPFFQLSFFLGKIGQQNVSYNILKQKKKSFLGYKNEKFKKSKNCHFTQEVNPWFWSKNGYFLNFFFWRGGGGGCAGKIGQENVF